jgi:Protein of unknown function (DUF3592)
MFGHHKLLATGVETEAVIVSMSLHTPDPGQLGTWHLDLTVPYPDGGSASFGARVSQTHLRVASVGDLVPVRYDPADRSEIVVDVPALDARHAARIAAQRQEDAAYAQHQVDALRAGTTGPVPPHAANSAP